MNVPVFILLIWWHQTGPNNMGSVDTEGVYYSGDACEARAYDIKRASNNKITALCFFDSIRDHARESIYNWDGKK